MHMQHIFGNMIAFGDMIAYFIILKKIMPAQFSEYDVAASWL